MREHLENGRRARESRQPPGRSHTATPSEPDKVVTALTDQTEGARDPDAGPSADRGRCVMMAVSQALSQDGLFNKWSGDNWTPFCERQH